MAEGRLCTAVKREAEEDWGSERWGFAFLRAAADMRGRLV
jgi:hypothetical protein